MQAVDPLSSGWNIATDPLKAEDASIMLAFLNVAGDPSILVDAADSRTRLSRVLTEIAGALDARGSLAIPMESTVSFNFHHIEGEKGYEEVRDVSPHRDGSIKRLLSAVVNRRSPVAEVACLNFGGVAANALQSVERSACVAAVANTVKHVSRLSIQT